jgi:hypothetical protein
MAAQTIEAIANLPQMQIGKFISGSETARHRPTNIPELNSDIENILWRRMASSSLCFIIARNPQLWDFDEVLQAEQEELENGISRFREYYQIPEYEPLEKNSKAAEFAEVSRPRQGAYVMNQILGFKNKQSVINKAIEIYQQ